MSNMNLEKEIPAPNKKSDFKFLKAQMDRAIAAEDYEQAAALQKFMNPESVTSTEKIDQDAELRAIKGVEEIRQKSYWQDKDVVDNSSFSKVLNNIFLDTKVSRENIKNNFVHRSESDGIEKVDRLIELYNDRNELRGVLETIKENFNRIWQPYREDAGLIAPEYNEYKSFYVTSNVSPEQMINIGKVPTYLKEPLEYWQNAYDNARLLLDIIEEVIDGMERKPLRE